uniref:Uncharacterized protein n=1 Tax=Anopheles atroparvus TaxID=41427 RepID=A0A182JM05_ANOAO
MLSTKKLFTEHLLTLVLTLSLLRIDPENYLDLQWGGRLAGVGDAGGWQLELLAVAPDYSNQSYVNRKFLPPIIEDLSRFEQPFIEQNYRGVQTYLLNVLDSNDSASPATTIAEERPPSPAPSVGVGGAGVVVAPAAHNATVNVLTNFDVEAEDIFLRTGLFEDTTSVLEQNMADLNDYDAILLENPTAKFDPSGAIGPDLESTIARARSLMASASDASQKSRIGEEEKATTSSSAAQAKSPESQIPAVSEANKKHDYEDDDDDEEEDDKDAVRREIAKRTSTQQKHLVSTDVDEVRVKEEVVQKDETTESNGGMVQDLTQEEMDLIEVLWKQDVDLGFTLNNAAVPGPAEGTGTSSADAASAGSIKCDNEDDLEKLKALLEIKNDKVTEVNKRSVSSADRSDFASFF